MATLIKSPQAEQDLLNIWLYIAEDNMDNADRFLDKINDTVQRLAEEKQKQQAQVSLQKSEDLFNSLLQKAFKGELTHKKT